MKKLTASTFVMLLLGLFALSTPAFAQSHGRHGDNRHGGHHGGQVVVHGGYRGGSVVFHGGYRNGCYSGPVCGPVYRPAPVYVPAPVYYGRVGYGRPGYVVPSYGRFPRSGVSVYVGYQGYYADPSADWVWDPYIGEWVRVTYHPQYRYHGFYSSHFGITIRVR